MVEGAHLDLEVVYPGRMLRLRQEQQRPEVDTCPSAGKRKKCHRRNGLGGRRCEVP